MIAPTDEVSTGHVQAVVPDWLLWFELQANSS